MISTTATGGSDVARVDAPAAAAVEQALVLQLLEHGLQRDLVGALEAEGARDLALADGAVAVAHEIEDLLAGRKGSGSLRGLGQVDGLLSGRRRRRFARRGLFLGRVLVLGGALARGWFLGALGRGRAPLDLPLPLAPLRFDGPRATLAAISATASSRVMSSTVRSLGSEA